MLIEIYSICSHFGPKFAPPDLDLPLDHYGSSSCWSPCHDEAQTYPGGDRARAEDHPAEPADDPEGDRARAEDHPPPLQAGREGAEPDDPGGDRAQAEGSETAQDLHRGGEESRRGSRSSRGREEGRGGEAGS